MAFSDFLGELTRKITEREKSFEQKIKEREKSLQEKERDLAKKEQDFKRLDDKYKMREEKLRKSLQDAKENHYQEREKKIEEMLKEIEKGHQVLEKKKQEKVKRMIKLENDRKKLYSTQGKKFEYLPEEDDDNETKKGGSKMDIMDKLNNVLRKGSSPKSNSNKYYNVQETDDLPIEDDELPIEDELDDRDLNDTNIGSPEDSDMEPEDNTDSLENDMDVGSPEGEENSDSSSISTDELEQELARRKGGDEGDMDNDAESEPDNDEDDWNKGPESDYGDQENDSQDDEEGNDQGSEDAEPKEDKLYPMKKSKDGYDIPQKGMEKENEDADPEAIDDKEIDYSTPGEEDSDGDDILSKLQDFLKGGDAQVIIIRKNSGGNKDIGMGNKMGFRNSLGMGMGGGCSSCGKDSECDYDDNNDENEDDMMQMENDESQGEEDQGLDVRPADDMGSEQGDMEGQPEEGGADTEISPEVEEQIRDYVKSTPDLTDDDFQEFVSGLGIDMEKLEEIVYKLVRELSGSKEEGGEGEMEPDMGDESGEEEMSPQMGRGSSMNGMNRKMGSKDSYGESMDILDKIKKKLLEQGEEGFGAPPALGGMGAPGGAGPMVPDAGPGGPDAFEPPLDDEESEEEKIPIEIEQKTKELESSGFELNANNAYDFYDKIRKRLNDEEGINTLNSIYEELPESKRHITPAKYLYDRVIKRIKDKQKEKGGGGSGGIGGGPSLGAAGAPMMPPGPGVGAGGGDVMGGQSGGGQSGGGALP